MTNTTPSELPLKASKTKRRFLTAEKKFQIYLEAQSSEKPIGELLRREGLFSTDLARIRHSGQGRCPPTSQRQTWEEARGRRHQHLRRHQAGAPGQGTGPGGFGGRTGHPAKKTSGGSWDR